MYCSKCGKKIPESASFCSGCSSAVTRKNSRNVIQKSITSVTKKTDVISSTMIISILINIFCAAMYFLPWIHLKEFDILGRYEAGSNSFSIIELLMSDKCTAVSFYKEFYNRDISDWINILNILCCLGIIALILHILSGGYELLEKKNTRISSIGYIITGVVSVIFIIISFNLKSGDFGVEIDIDPELTGGLASSVYFEITQYLSITSVPGFAAAASVIGLIKNNIDYKKNNI